MTGWRYNPAKFQFEYWYKGRVAAFCTVEAWDYYWRTEGWGRYNAK